MHYILNKCTHFFKLIIISFTYFFYDEQCMLAQCMCCLAYLLYYTCLSLCLGTSSAVKPKLEFILNSISLLPPHTTDTGRHLQQLSNAGWMG